MASNKRKSARQRYSERIDFEAMITGAKKADIARHCAHCLNISQGGLGITTDHRPKEGDVLRLSIPFKENLTLPVFAEVVWIAAEDDSFRAGMRFLA